MIIDLNHMEKYQIVFMLIHRKYIKHLLSITIEIAVKTNRSFKGGRP